MQMRIYVYQYIVIAFFYLMRRYVNLPWKRAPSTLFIDLEVVSRWVTNIIASDICLWLFSVACNAYTSHLWEFQSVLHIGAFCRLSLLPRANYFFRGGFVFFLCYLHYILEKCTAWVQDRKLLDIYQISISGYIYRVVFVSQTAFHLPPFTVES